MRMLVGLHHRLLNRGTVKMAHMAYTKLLLLCTLLVLPSEARSQSRPTAGASGYQKLRLTQVEAPSLKASNTTQFLAANSKGKLFLLRGDTLEVFRLGSDGGFDRRVGKLACEASSESAYAAARDPTGLSCAGRKDAIWRASWNAYRLQKLSSSEKPERELVVGKGEVEWQKLDKEEQARETGDRRVQGLHLVAFGAGSSAPAPRGVVRAL